jgi:hypothetical protein
MYNSLHTDQTIMYQRIHFAYSKPVLRIRIRIRIHMFLDLLDPDPFIFKQNSKKNLDFYCFVTSVLLFIFEKGCKCTFKK